MTISLLPGGCFDVCNREQAEASGEKKNKRVRGCRREKLLPTSHFPLYALIFHFPCFFFFAFPHFLSFFLVKYPLQRRECDTCFDSHNCLSQLLHQYLTNKGGLVFFGGAVETVLSHPETQI